ncbi:hypothetical protein NDR87_16125 [Nocardia sp. CDC159]|uniref:Uncharacterized protein n=1 Tax=Nocardia pulmonis TaxID=2951408 RepID=A0A9X2E6Z4_9NOCA|nr:MULTISPECIES: hypothetical protein [Nocardia]MCM6775379.1 hypothetical protein [Nocardia pulmonis]MCM6787887.1 hypothetical protein [Nocardia sp. CDC159]
MLDTRFTGNSASSVDPLGGLLDTSSAPVSFGYYEENAADADTIARCHRPRTGPVGWWNRHRRIRLAVGMALVLNLGFLPAVQDGILTALSHVA